jgi:hypothetical protein
MSACAPRNHAWVKDLNKSDSIDRSGSKSSGVIALRFSLSAKTCRMLRIEFTKLI